MLIIARVLREPLVAFALIGVALFALDRGLGPGRAPTPQSIEVSDALREDLARRFAAENGRPPGPDEERALLDQYVSDEVMVREAQLLGLGRGDPVIRRRLIQRLEFLAEDLAQVDEPDDATLSAYLESHGARYVAPARVTVEHVFVRSGDHARARAETVLERLRAGQAPGRLGDPFVHGPVLTYKSRAQLAALMGQDFADAVMDAPAAEWHGPVPSSYGVHLVRVRERHPESLPGLHEIRERVRRDWLDEARERAARDWLDGLRARYQVIDAGRGASE